MQARWLTAILHREEEVVVAECPEVGTVEEALANLREATEFFLGEYPPVKACGASTRRWGKDPCRAHGPILDAA
jgi:hypothetical protein